jgi:hypothetical protein
MTAFAAADSYADAFGVEAPPVKGVDASNSATPSFDDLYSALNDALLNNLEQDMPQVMQPK